VIDAIPLNDKIKKEIDALTNNGEKIEAWIGSHPFHTLSIPLFNADYPKAEYYGCPRHLRRFPDIKWSGDLNDCKVRNKWSPDVEMRVPNGAEFENPLPETRNHFSSVLVYHKESRTIHVDDTICYAPPQGFAGGILKLAGFKEGYMSFHLSLKNYGLLPHPEAPFEFRDWVQKLIDDWDFDNICTAHIGNKVGGAKQQLTDILKKSEPMFKKLSEQKKKDKEKGKNLGSSSDGKGKEKSDEAEEEEDPSKYNVNGTECG